MIGMTLNQAKSKFLDTRKIMDRTERAELRMLSKFGGSVRTTARRSIRRRKAISAPGSPPSSHTDLLRNFIFYFVEKEEKNVVIGPILLNKPSEGDTRAPELLEHGGDVVRRRYDRRRQTLGGPRTLRYQARPSMQPAFEIQLPKAPEYIRDQVRE